MSTKNCQVCGGEYTPHHIYRHKGPVCRPNGYCGGVWDEREDAAAQIAEERKAHAETRAKLEEAREVAMMAHDALCDVVDDNYKKHAAQGSLSLMHEYHRRNGIECPCFPSTPAPTPDSEIKETP